MATDRKATTRWTVRNQDWVKYDDGHYGCLRFGEFKAGVKVRIRNATGRVAEITGIVTGLVPTWGDGVTVAVDWQNVGKGIRLTPCWPAAYLEIVSKGVNNAHVHAHG